MLLKCPLGINVEKIKKQTKQQQTRPLSSYTVKRFWDLWSTATWEITQWKNNFSLHNYISEKAIKLYSPHIPSHFCLADIFSSLTSVCLPLYSSSPSVPHWMLSLVLASASPSESTPLSPMSPHTTTLMPLQGPVRTSRTGDRIHFDQTVCGCGKDVHRAVGCLVAPQDLQWPHHECSSALKLQLTCCAVDRLLKVQQRWQKCALLSLTECS